MMLRGFYQFLFEQKWVVLGVMALLVFAGISFSPFDLKLGVPRNPIHVDAIPDLGDNQQIIYSHWPGYSPQDVEDQITYPLTSQLLGLAGVRTVRAYSNYGFSSIHIIFEEGVEFYWARTRILEKLASLSPGSLPVGVTPQLGPDATALGQVYWYTLEAQDAEGHPVGAWDLAELKSIQEFQVKPLLQSVSGVAEVASVGGMDQEYQVQVNPQKLNYHGLSLQDVYRVLSQSNRVQGAGTIELNRVEYILRSQGSISQIEDLQEIVVKSVQGQPVFLKDIAKIQLGPQVRRGALDQAGTEVVGGVVVARYGANPMEVIQRLEGVVSKMNLSLPKREINGQEIQLKLKPFYNRASLIRETVETLRQALHEEILMTVLVMLFLLGSLRSSFLVALTLPLGVLLTFVLMKLGGVEANVVALSGIAIAIGTMVDMGIILVENIHSKWSSEKPVQEIVLDAVVEVTPPILTALATTLISFIPVFALTASEGKLFHPLAYTKSFALFSALVVTLLLLPLICLFIYRSKKPSGKSSQVFSPSQTRHTLLIIGSLVLTWVWQPGQGEYHFLLQWAWVAILVFGLLALAQVFIKLYPKILAVSLEYKKLCLSLPLLLVLIAAGIWKNMGSEFMPSLDEGSFLVMPTTMAHASFEEAQSQLETLDQLLQEIPEVKKVVGKLGRAETALDPAPISMFETMVEYHPEYRQTSDGQLQRMWRDHINSPDDIWQEILKKIQIPGMTSAPKLMPIQTRQIMLQTGMRSPYGIQLQGQSLEEMESFGYELEKYLQEIPEVKASSVYADRVVGKPYLEYQIDRVQAGRYGLTIASIQDQLSTAIGGKLVSYSIEGRERYPIRLQYLRSFRDEIRDLHEVMIQTPSGELVSLSQLAQLKYQAGPMVIKSENGLLSSYVTFDKSPGASSGEAAQAVLSRLDSLWAQGQLQVPPGMQYQMIGSYQDQLRAEETFRLILPLVFLLIALILWVQFKSFSQVLIILMGVLVAWTGGFILLGVYQLWEPINMSVAVWVGFIALFGVASDDGVVMSTYLQQEFRDQPLSIGELRSKVVQAATKRIRPCMMTTSTTLLALIPVLMSQGRGSDIMFPMALPIFGGMLIAVLTVFIVPVLFTWRAEVDLNSQY